MDEERIDQLTNAAEKTRELRREYNRLLDQAMKGAYSEYNLEDLMRLVGTVEAAYNHLLAALASDGDIYCVLKHLSYAIILEGEMDNPHVEDLYDILAIVSNGKLEPCASCKREEE